jgi:catechol 2,3-dioxygenase-like lactoylglutathione lyase family enzyme
VKRPQATRGLRHLALLVEDLEACRRFYVDLLGMEVEWEPDADNLYLTSQGQDNLALHRAPPGLARGAGQALDHLGFVLESPEQVDEWHVFLKAHGVAIRMMPRTHRDGARSFYCNDPDGNSVQLIYHPPVIACVG